MSYYLSVIKDSPSGFWKLDEESGLVANDSSGCGNNGSYIGLVDRTRMPIVSGGLRSTVINEFGHLEFQITKDFSGLVGTGGFGTTETSDNDFSLEVWFHPKNISSETPVFADSNGIGIYWDNGNVVFKIESERLDYTVPDQLRSLHVVGVYSVGNMYLYVDGQLARSKSIDVNFTNENLTFNCGPANSDEYFLVDSPAVYRYSLSAKQIQNHYYDSFTNTESNIVIPDKGELFRFSEKYYEISTKFVYPAQKQWEYFINDNLLYRESSNSIYLSPNSSSGNFVQEIVLNISKDYVSSQIEWLASNGVSFFISDTGEDGSWVECSNGKALPGFEQGSNFSSDKVIYLKAEFSSLNSSQFIPELYYLKVYFYSDKKVYSHNGGSIVSVSQPNSGSVWDINLSNNENFILSRNYHNGIRPNQSAFFVDTLLNVKCLEMIFTPENFSNGYLFYNKYNEVETSIQLSSTGDIIKSNISGLYVNGQDISSLNNISEYIDLGEPNYVLIKFLEDVSGQIWINGKQEGGARSGVLLDNMYQNIAIYESAQVDHQTHYNMYIGKSTGYAQDSAMSVTQDYVKTYSRDRVVVNNA